MTISAATDVTAVLMLLFFLAGVVVGCVALRAFSARRAAGPQDGDGEPGRPGRAWRYPPADEPDDDEPDLPPWWQAHGDV